MDNKGRVFRKLCQSKSFESIGSGFKMNFKLQINTVPRHNGLAPLVGYIPDGDKEEFFERVFGGKSALCFGDFPQLSVELLWGWLCRWAAGFRCHQLRQTCAVIQPLNQGRFCLFTEIWRAFNLWLFHLTKKLFCDPTISMVFTDTVFWTLSFGTTQKFTYWDFWHTFLNSRSLSHYPITPLTH